MKPWLQVLRPHHWVKSGFCVAALFFAGQSTSWPTWLSLLPLLLGFSGMASAGYLVNDVFNQGEDRLHPRKKGRPVASGRLKSHHVLLVAFFLALVSWLGPFLFYRQGELSRRVPEILLAYLFLTVSYSVFFRRIPFVDVAVLAGGFVMRVASGAFALNLVPTAWLLGCTFTVSLMLGLGKRLGEWRLISKRGYQLGVTRQALKGYSEELLQTLIGTCGLLAGTLYVVYCLNNPDRLFLLASIAPMVVGLMSYLRVALRSDQVEMPETLFFKSPILVGAIVVWLGLVALEGVVS